MINQQLIAPRSIVLVGGSNQLTKPGGSALMNLKQGFTGDNYVVNAKEDEVQGIRSFRSVEDVPNADMAIISVPAVQCVQVVEVLAKRKGVKAFVVFSAGFSELNDDGAVLEKQLLKIVTDAGACLLGPNCSGMLNVHHQSIFTQPLPIIDPKGVDMVSSSGGTATFIIEDVAQMGLRFNSVFCIGNAAQIGVEEVIRYWDETFVSDSPRVKIVYMETVHNPQMLLTHASSLVRKGCKIVALKSGTSDSGMRAAASHTGAMASSDVAVDALFRKAGIIRCHTRQELAHVAAVLTMKPLKGNNIAVVSQAGGPAVILTDALAKAGLSVPELPQAIAEELRTHLLPGSAVGNPIDLLGTGTGEHLDIAVDYCTKKVQDIDGLIVIYGDPGVTDVEKAYNILHQKIQENDIPIYSVLPSKVMAVKPMCNFVQKGNLCFTDEAVLAAALGKAFCSPVEISTDVPSPQMDISAVRQVVENQQNGWMPPADVRRLLHLAGIRVAPEVVSPDKQTIVAEAEKMGYPLVLKVVGPLHKSDVGGVKVGIASPDELATEVDRMMQIPDATAVMIQPLVAGKELFVGAKYEPNFGHTVLCGLGGIFVDVLKDVASGLAPLTPNEVRRMIRSLKTYPIIEGVRGQKGIHQDAYVEVIVRLSHLLMHTPEIQELDLNPLMATDTDVVVVDARIRIEK